MKKKDSKREPFSNDLSIPFRRRRDEIIGNGKKKKSLLWPRTSTRSDLSFHRTDAVRIIYSFNSLECLFSFSFSFIEMYSSTTPHRASFRLVDFERKMERDVVENWIKLEYRVWWRNDRRRASNDVIFSIDATYIPLCLCEFLFSVQPRVCYFLRGTARCPCGFKRTVERFSFDAPQPSYRTDSFSLSHQNLRQRIWYRRGS